jgi:N utilization substance protein B
LQALCVFDSVGGGFADELDRFLQDSVNYTDLGWSEPPTDDLVQLARSMALGAWECRARCDDLLRGYVADWSIERMQPVDRNILRLGLYELLACPETPPPVVLNEAVELAAVFGGQDSKAFVNGVLDGLRRKLGEAATTD